jgi:hypothetical protein
MVPFIPILPQLLSFESVSKSVADSFETHSKEPNSVYRDISDSIALRQCVEFAVTNSRDLRKLRQILNTAVDVDL